MKFHKREKPNIFVALEYVLCAVILFATLSQHHEVASDGFTASFLVLLVQFLCILIFPKYKKKYFIPTAAIIVVSFVSVMISTLLLDGEISFEAAKEYIIFVSTIILTFVLLCMPVKKATVAFVLKFNILISLLYPIAYLFFPQKVENEKGQLLYLNFSNPNLTGMWILLSILYLFLAVILLKSKLYRVLSIISLAFNLFLLYKTGARNAWLALVLFVLLLVISAKKKRKFGKAGVIFINLVPILFIPVYLTLIAPITELGWFSFLSSEGKPLDSRVWIWTDTLNKLHGYWLTGAYPLLSGNKHNAYLVVLSSYGIITLVLLIGFFTAISLSLNRRARDKKGLFCLSAFFTTLFMGFGEGALFSGGQGIYILCCGFILLTRYYCTRGEKGKL